MVDFTRKRLQVFVSSTYTDLKEERQAAVEAILTAGHIPAGMELFTAGDESQMEAIKQWIDESDVYLLILGGRYGSVEPTSGKSYTHLEYEYALEQGKPLFACVINDSALDDKVKNDGRDVIETDNPAKLKDFRSVVLTKLVKFWDDTKDIKITIGETLSHFARKDDLVGWVRADQSADMTSLADEITRLSKENFELRTELQKSSSVQSKLAPRQMLQLLEKENLLEAFIENSSFMMDVFSPEDIGFKTDILVSFCELDLVHEQKVFSEKSSTKFKYYYSLSVYGRTVISVFSNTTAS